MNVIKTLFFILLTFMVIDYILLTKIFATMWSNQITKIQGGKGPEFRPLVAGILTYLLMASGVLFFAVKDSKSRSESLQRGALLGLLMYGVFDGTNYVLFKNYELNTVVVDIACGVLVTTSAALVGDYFYRSRESN
jgi:uncharacterized membrane protein